MENPHQARILELLVVIGYDTVSYIKDIESYNISEFTYLYLLKKDISKYNYIICECLRYFIINLKYKPYFIDDYKIRKIKKMEEYEPEFLKLLKDLLTDNFLNIKYDFTKFILIHFDPEIIIKYLDEHALLYLLPRINPDTFNFNCPKQEEFFRNFYYKQTSLKLAWFGAVIKSTYFGPCN